MVLAPVLLRCISSMTLRPDSRKLVRQDDCRLFTSVGVILHTAGTYIKFNEKNVNIVVNSVAEPKLFVSAPAQISPKSFGSGYSF
jgi:hypothetical protein